jgi:hypothetical protein
MARKFIILAEEFIIEFKNQELGIHKPREFIILGEGIKNSVLRACDRKRGSTSREANKIYCPFITPKWSGRRRKL